MSSPTASSDKPWLGIDVGGANIKAAHTDGWANSMAFPLWKHPKSLGVALVDLLQHSPPVHGFALTMTGELADCYATRAEGVLSILEQCTSVIPAPLVRVYCVDGKWRTTSAAGRDPWKAAASNWHALSQYIALEFPSDDTLVVDIGSTTTDLIPIRNGRIAIDSTTDSQRLQCGALVYTGIERSNVAGICRELPLFGASCPVMNEWFASALDVHLWLGDLPEQPDCLDTADGKPASRNAARFRLARLVGEDGTTLTDEDVDAIAQHIRREQAKLIAQSMEKVWSYSSQAHPKKPSHKDRNPSKKLPDRLVVCGHGPFLLEDALQSLGWNVPRVDWTKELGLQLSRCGPSYAIAMLAKRQIEID